MASAVEVVRAFRRLRVLVVGDAMLDSYLEGTAARLCTEGPVPVVHKTTEQRVPGGAANAAANLRALGADVMFVGVVGNDLAASLLRASLSALGVDDRWLVEDAATGTSHKLRILADGQYVVRFDDGGTREYGEYEYSQAVQARLLAMVERAFARCDAVMVSDYGYGVASDAVVERLRALRRDRPCPLLVDSKAIDRFHAAGATVVTPNLLEACLAVGEPPGAGLPGAGLPGAGPSRARSAGPPVAGPPDSGASLDLTTLERVGRRLLDLIDAEHAAITLAAGGVCLIARAGATQHLPAHPVPHSYDVGAGDSFAAAMTLALGAGANVAEAAQIGIDAAGIAVSRPGTAVVQHQELLQRVSLRDLAADDRHTGRDGRQQAVARLAARLAAERRAGRAVVFTNGVFDILHAGHVEFLRQAKELGDVLVVGINTDRSARQLKGKARPVTSARDRLALVGALDPVDHVVLFDEDEPSTLIRALRPHIHVKGGDYADEALPEAEAVREVGGRIVILPLVGSMSTSRVIDHIVALATGVATAAAAGGER